MVAPAPIEASLTGRPAPTAIAAAAPTRMSGRLCSSTESTSTRSKRWLVPVATDASRSTTSLGSVELSQWHVAVAGTVHVVDGSRPTRRCCAAAVAVHHGLAVMHVGCRQIDGIGGVVDDRARVEHVRRLEQMHDIRIGVGAMSIALVLPSASARVVE